MDFLKEAFKEANKARIKGEIPIGCVIVLDDKIISRGHNIREKSQNALMHAEVVAIAPRGKFYRQRVACYGEKSGGANLDNARLFGVRAYV